MTTTPTAESIALGRRLRIAREVVDWNQAELARASGVIPSTVSMLEAGKVRDPGARTLYRLALALGVTIEELLGHQPLHRTAKAAARRRYGSLR